MNAWASMAKTFSDGELAREREWWAGQSTLANLSPSQSAMFDGVHHAARLLATIADAREEVARLRVVVEAAEDVVIADDARPLEERLMALDAALDALEKPREGN